MAKGEMTWVDRQMLANGATGGSELTHIDVQAIDSQRLAFEAQQEAGFRQAMEMMPGDLGDPAAAAARRMNATHALHAMHEQKARAASEDARIGIERERLRAEQDRTTALLQLEVAKLQLEEQRVKIEKAELILEVITTAQALPATERPAIGAVINYLTGDAALVEAVEDAGQPVVARLITDADAQRKKTL